MNIVAIVLALLVQGMCALPIPLDGTWKQTYSNVYVQSTTEIDWHCIQVFVTMTDPAATQMTFYKKASLHGGPIMVTTPTYEAHLVNDTFTLREKNYDIHPYSNDTYVITGKDDPSMFVWTREDDSSDDNDEQAPIDVPRLTAFIKKLGIETHTPIGNYGKIVQTYDSNTC
jgi:hypothetical protein